MANKILEFFLEPEADTDQLVEMHEMVIETQVDVPLEGLVEVAAIYETLYDTPPADNQTIFHVATLKQSMPETLTEAIKKETVRNIIQSTGGSLETMVQDGEKRREALSAVRTAFNDETAKLIHQYEEAIIQFTTMIEEEKAKIQKRQMLDQEQTAKIHEEMERLNSIIAFASL